MQVVSDTEYRRTIERVMEYNYLYNRYKRVKRLLVLLDEIDSLKRKISVLERCSKKIQSSVKHLTKKSLKKRMSLNIPLKENDDTVREDVYLLYKSIKRDLYNYK